MATLTTPLEMRLYDTLRRIAREYRSAESLLKRGDAGLAGEEALQMAYENIQFEARRAIRGLKHSPAPGKER